MLDEPTMSPPPLVHAWALVPLFFLVRKVLLDIILKWAVADVLLALQQHRVRPLCVLPPALST